MKNQVLKNLAMNARNRLINRSSDNGQLKQKTAVYSPNVKFRIISNEDSDFLARANALGDEDLINPLKKLIDENLFSRLDAKGKERYLLEIIDKYARFRDKVRMENERQKIWG